MRIRRAVWAATLALASSFVGASAMADTPAQPPAHPVKDAKDAVKDARKDLKDAKKDAKDDKKDGKDDKDKKDDKKDVKDAKKELKEAREKLHETRKDRREEMKKAIKDKWGDILGKPKVREELKLHAQRMARINHMAMLAKETDKDKLAERIDKLKTLENARHDKRMAALKAKGGEE